MKEIKIPYLNTNKDAFNNEGIFTEMDNFKKHSIDNTWPEFKTACQANFSIAYSDDRIFVKYWVIEDNLSASVREINTAVHKDNCVEFFVAFADDESYYNIEFNCLGIGKMAYGKRRFDRSFVPPSMVSEIDAHIVLKSTELNRFAWQILLSIPLKAFYYHNLRSLTNSSAKANFYKCGDELPNPHYLCWNEVLTESPDFHSPAYFGKLSF